MSNPSPPPEQTAASTPVSHAQADSTAATDAGLPVNHVPVLPTAPELPPTSPSQPDVPVASQGAPSAQTTLPTPIEGDLNKKSRPAALQRQSGPSLLTQALASARGIPAATPQTGPSQSPSLQPYDSQSIHPRHDQTIRQNPDTSTNLTTNDGPSTGNTSGSITPRSSSRSVAMASSATLTTTAAPPTLTGDVPILPTTFTLRNTDYRGVDKAPSSQRVPHGPFNTQSTSSNKRESDHKSFELPIRTGPFNNILDHDTTASPTVLEQRSATQPSLNQPDTSRESRHSRPRKMEPRVSMGPEKAWSIGTGDLDMHQDGQVEKSITEVLSGLEPNRGSRKASHSLRFFKEGLPEDKIKRRETRLTPSREKLSPTAEVPIDADKSGTKGSTQHYQDAFPSPKSIDDKYAEQLSADDNSVRSPLPALGDVRSSHDYFGDAGKELRDRVLTGDASTESSIHRRDEDSRLLHEEENRSLGEERERRRSSEATKSDEHTEDGDESGEEKISSAVFLPHQGLEESTELEPARSNDIQHPQAASGAHPRKEDFHPWLVKADEPEADVTSPEEEKFEGAPRPAQEGRHNHTHDTAYPAGYNVSLAGDTEAVEVSHHGVVRPLSHQYEDHVHDHQHRQPLEAIELIPYRHQVGGHTTLWRFSKRAVCKQLNNRENEFYERIERFHRDLLAFLPRYIGVLNVTFHKQPRRRSTVRKDEGASHERKQIDQDALRQVLKANGASAQEGVAKSEAPREAASAHTRVISQSMQSASNQVPTVTFVDNQHILPRNLLQPTSLSPRGSPKSLAQRREVPIEIPPEKNINPLLARPSLEDRHANSWGATTVNKKLRNEVFNDAFLKQPIAIQRHHNKANRRAIPRKTLQQILRQSNSDPNLVSSPMRLGDDHSHGSSTRPESPSDTAEESQRMSIDLPRPSHRGTNGSNEPKDVTGTSAPEPDILSEQPPSQRKKRRYSGTVLRRKPKDVSESRGDLHVFEEPDDAGCKADHEDEGATTHLENGSAKEELSRTPTRSHHGQDVDFAMGGSTYPSTVTSRATSPTAEFHKIPRPINPKEAQTQRDSRREYFLLLEDLTAGMKRPCIMDLKMGTRQYGVDANPKKQKSQQRKCAETTSRELGVRVCGLQVWDIPTQTYVFKDKYYGRDIKAGQEFQDALTRFLYDGADPSSILRHIPTVLNKLSQLEVIISRLKGYRFYAASLLMFYDGDQSDEGNDNAIEDSTTDFATDTEEHRDQRRRRNKREIDFKMADFANSVMAGDLTGGKPCPPQHPNEPDHGFLRGLRSLRRYFLKIQRDTRVQMDLAIPFRENGSDIDLRNIDDESAVSE